MAKIELDYSKGIFLYEDQTYIVDITGMMCWMIDINDDDDPITAWEIVRDRGKWTWRHVGFDGPYAQPLDDDFNFLVENIYKKYTQAMIYDNR